MAKGKYQEWLTDDGLLVLEAWARDGLIDEQIAHNMGIAVATLYRYKQAYREICNALKKGKAVVDIQVENALLKRALGYRYAEVISECVPVYEDGGNIDSCMQVTKKIEKEVMPDTTAQIFWLKNRMPNKWRDRRHDEVTITQPPEIIDDLPAQVIGFIAAQEGEPCE